MQNHKFDNIKNLAHQLIKELSRFNTRDAVIAAMSQTMPEIPEDFVIDVMDGKYDFITVKQFNGSSKIDSVRAIRAVTGMDLKASLDFMNDLEVNPKMAHFIGVDYITARDMLMGAGFSIDY